MYRFTDDLKVESIVNMARLDVGEIDFPLLVKVYEYWDRVRGEKFAPSLKEFHLDDLPPAIIPNMAVVDFIGPPLDFLYRFFGSAMVEASGMELTGKRYYADKVKGYGFVNAKMFPTMIEERRPIVSRTEWVSVKGLRYATTTVRMPLSADGTNVTGGVTVNQYQQIKG